MKNKKGFTLIELLAVIVILAVIALIATPIIMNVIHDSKKGAAKDAMYGYVKAVELSAVREVTPTKNALSGTYTIKDGNLYNGNTKVLDVTVKGTKPKDGGTITLENGKVTDANISFGDITVDYDNGKAEIVEKENPDSSPSPTSVPDTKKASFIFIIGNTDTNITSGYENKFDYVNLVPTMNAEAAKDPSKLIVDVKSDSESFYSVTVGENFFPNVYRIKFEEPGYALIKIDCNNTEQVAGPIYPVDMCLNYEYSVDIPSDSEEKVEVIDDAFPQYGPKYGDYERAFIHVTDPGYIEFSYWTTHKPFKNYLLSELGQTTYLRVIFIKESEFPASLIKG